MDTSKFINFDSDQKSESMKISDEEEEKGEKEERIDKITLLYYSRKDIQQAICSFCRKREAIPRYFEGFGKRPDTLEYESDIMQQVKKGATSFHCSEELWKDSLQLSTEMSEEQLNNLREGWDLLIDIDSKYLDYSKIAAELIIQALNFHNVKNIGIKFSGSKGFHIIVPWKAFPKQINEQETRKMFPEWPRIISLYLTELIKRNLIEKITDLMAEEKRSYVKDMEAPKKVMPDIILVSPRHLFRAPYSLHEKTSLASIVLKKEEIKNFQPRDADPLKVIVKNYLPEAKEEEARELLVSALDWYKSQTKEEKKEKSNKEFQEVKIDKSQIIYPPCIQNIMKGLPDGRKRALFILINFLRSLNFTQEEVEKKIEEWNKKNPKQLKQGYINSQISWTFKQKKFLPPNCDKDYYKGIGVCDADELCGKVKNPVNYTVRKSRRK